MSHKTELEIVDGDLRELAWALEDLRYDVGCEFLFHLANAFLIRSENDLKSGKVQLANRLIEVKRNLDEARFELEKAWKICEPNTVE